MTFLSFSKTMHMCIFHLSQFNYFTAKLNFLYPEPWPETVQSLAALTAKFKELHSSMTVSNGTE